MEDGQPAGSQSEGGGAGGGAAPKDEGGEGEEEGEEEEGAAAGGGGGGGGGGPPVAVDRLARELQKWIQCSKCDKWRKVRRGGGEAGEEAGEGGAAAGEGEKPGREGPKLAGGLLASSAASRLPPAASLAFPSLSAMCFPPSPTPSHSPPGALQPGRRPDPRRLGLRRQRMGRSVRVVRSAAAALGPSRRVRY